MEFTAWLGPMIGAAAAVVAAGIAAWIRAANRRALALLERRANIDTQLSDKRRELFVLALGLGVGVSHHVRGEVKWNIISRLAHIQHRLFHDSLLERRGS